MTTDRRVQRTRDVLQKALIDLIGEGSYDSITIQDIVDRANVARATFYVHFSNKDDLFMSCHEAIVNEFRYGLLHSQPLSREELLSREAPAGMVYAYRHLLEARTRLNPIFQGKDGPLILRRIHDWTAQEIESNLRAVFVEEVSTVPLEVLANYLAGAQVALLHGWLAKRPSQTPENLAQTLHRLQRAAICDAFGIGNGA